MMEVGDEEKGSGPATAAINDHVGVSRPSLARLKDLDSLPDLQSQLREAKQLCTHSARAEMLLRWLIQKLKISQDFRMEPESWETLTSTIRLLSPERVANLLSHDFLGTIQSSLRDATTVFDLFPSLAGVLDILLEISQGLDGASVKALLSLPATEAASFLGYWLQAIYDTASMIVLQDRGAALSRHFLMGTEVWALRKHTQQDNEVFASECVSPAASLLTFLSEQADGLPTKRKWQGRSAESIQDPRTALESLLAKHIFLPARISFFKAQAQAQTSMKGQRTNGARNPTDMIRELLEPLKISAAKHEEGARRQLIAVPMLLDVALRSSPAPTPRQRLQERPWIEAVFSALHACTQISGGEFGTQAVLTEMLSVIARRASLSDEKLNEIVETYGNLGDRNEKPTDWKLIAQIIELNADVFANEQKADALFCDLTTALRRLDESLPNDQHTAEHSVEDDASFDGHRALARDKIVLPILKAFARARKLTNFIKLWWKQLQHDEHNDMWSVWLELQDSFEILLEDSLTERQILNIFNGLRDPLLAVTRSGTSIQSPVSQSEIGATIVIMAAVLGGVKSDVTLDALYDSFDQLLKHISELLDVNIDGTEPSLQLSNERRIWKLLAELFEFWLPLWTARQVDPGEVKSRLNGMVNSGAVKYALAALTIHPAHNPEARDAALFVAGLRAQLNKHCDDAEAGQSTESLLEQIGALSSDACLRFPDLLPAVEPDVRTKLATKWLSAATGSGPEHASSLRGLRGVVTAAAAQSQQNVVQSIVQACLGHLESIGQKHNDQSRAAGYVVIEALLTLPASSITRTWREKILDALTERDLSAGWYAEINVQNRLALMVQLMELPNATAKLATDPTVLWHLVPSINKDGERSAYQHPDDDYLWDSKLLELLDQLVKLVLKHLLSTQDLDRSQAMLLGFSKQVDKHIGVFCDNKAIQHGAPLCTIIARTIRELELGAKDPLKHRLIDQGSSRIERIVRTLYQRIERITQAVHPNFFDKRSAELIRPFSNALATTPQVIGQDVNSQSKSFSETHVYLKELLQRQIDRCVRSSDPTAADAIPALAAALAQACEISCTHDKSGIQASETTLFLLKCELRPAEREAVILTFGRLVNGLDNRSKISQIEKLLFPDEDFVDTELDDLVDRTNVAHMKSIRLQSREVSTASLVLTKSCISRLNDVDLESIDGVAPRKILTRLLALASDSYDLTFLRAACSCILTILREKPFLTNQYTIEATLIAMRELIQERPGTSVLYMDVCRIISTLLLQYRSRLQGRYHLVVELFQDLMSQLFMPSKAASQRKIKYRHLKKKHAQALARLLTLFCEPPAQLRSRSKSSELVDESRKEQAHVGRFVQYILHHYCTQVLKGSLGEGMKDALTPGLWSMIEAMQINEAEGIKSLSAAMNNNERAVLRGVYEDWRRFGKWRGG